MDLFTGDEVGLIKHSEIFLEKDEDEKQPPTTSAPWTQMNKQEAIECIALDINNSRVWIARKSGCISAYNMDDGNLLLNKSLFVPRRKENGDLILNKHKKAEHFIGIFFDSQQGRLISLTDTGKLFIFTNDQQIEEIKLDQELLCAFRAHSQHSHLIATGGDEREVCVWDLSKDHEGFQPTWISKNVKNDFLDLRVPVWVTAIEWLPSSQSTLIVGTAYHQVRIYDTSKARRPLFSIELGKYPIKCLEFMPFSQDLVAIADNRGHLTLWNTSTRKIARSFKGIPGTITSISGSTKNQWITVVGLDRYLRVFDAKTGVCLWKLFLKQRLTAVKVFEKEEKDNLWDSIPIIEEAVPRKKRKQ